MKKKLCILLLILPALLFQCAVQKKTTYDLPKNLSPERKTELLANLDKGSILFKNNCSGCHGIFTKGKDGIPNFTETEIINYMSAYQTNDMKNHAVLKQLQPEEISMIMTFLRLRNFNGKAKH